MNRFLLYIHGYNSSAQSNKFQIFLKHFGKDYDLACMEWTPESDFDKLMKQAEDELSLYDFPIITGSSTGANFAYQLRERLKRKGKNSVLILFSPLFDLKTILADLTFSENLQSAVRKIENPKNALVIADPNDTVVDQKPLFSGKFENLKIVIADDDHKLPLFENYLSYIDDYIEENLW